MPVPAEILAVERPKNTVVYVYGKNKDRYGVKARIGCKHKNGKNYPVNGPTVGHIIDGVYVPIPEQEDEPASISQSPADIKDWAGEELLLRLGQELLDELRQVYDRKDSEKIFCIAALRVLNPGIRDCELKEAYEQSFLSEHFPDCSLSKNTVSGFQEDLGRTYSRIVQFNRNRAASIKSSDSVLIDGTLKTNDSKVNSFSEWSRKAKLKGRRDLSVLYAFDLTQSKPVCSEVFPGNMLDLTSYSDFLITNDIQRGVVICDKGFPASSIEELLSERPDLKYLNPLRRSARIAMDHHMYNYESVLPGEDGIQYRKSKVEGKEKWLYSFRNPKEAAKEEQDWITRHYKDETYSDEEYQKARVKFGTIVFESNLDAEPEEVYRMYSTRWEIELVMRYYKSSLEFSETRVQSDEAVIGSEFIDFISVCLTFRLKNLYEKEGLLDNRTYRQILRILKHARKVRMDGTEWTLVKTNKNQIEILEKLGVLPSPEIQEKPVKRKRGRPRKSARL